jgi:hypothetical protein
MFPLPLYFVTVILSCPRFSSGEEEECDRLQRPYLQAISRLFQENAISIRRESLRAHLIRIFVHFLARTMLLRYNSFFAVVLKSREYRFKLRKWQMRRDNFYGVTMNSR